jgi:hypothetical protein
VTAAAHVPQPVGPRRILSFWFPLAATWLMMAIEGPYVAAIIARLGDPVPNLAAYGVAFAFAFLAEAPIIMVLTAANALVRDRQSFVALRRFVYALNAFVTLAMLVGISPPVFRFVTERLIGLPPDIARLTHMAMVALLPWPAAIGYRRFFQGILVRHNMPRRVAYGTIVRLVSMSIAAGTLALTTSLPGVVIGAIALAAGVVFEAVASRLMARRLVAALLAETSVAADANAAAPLTTREIARFYYPLALTSLLAIAINPVVVFFIGRSQSPLESLAVLPVIVGLTFIFRSGAMAYQEVAVALIGPNHENREPVAGVAAVLASAATFGLAAILFTPLAEVWFGRISGLTPELVAFALWPARVLAVVPALEYLLTFQRAQLILARRTRAITLATAVEVTTIGVALFIGVSFANLVGALAATIGLLFGRVAGNLVLLAATRAGKAGEARVASPAANLADA